MYRYGFIYTVSFCLLLILSCNDNAGVICSAKKCMPAVKKNSKLSLLAIIVKENFRIPEEFLFKYSECRDNCNDPEGIISKRYCGDTLKIRLGTIMNCAGGFTFDIKTVKDTLDLRIGLKSQIYKRSDGTVDTFTVVADCDCYFYFDIGIRNVKKPFSVFLINGHKPGSKRMDDML